MKATILRMAKKKQGSLPSSNIASNNAGGSAAVGSATRSAATSSLLTGALVPIPTCNGHFRMNVHVKPGANTTSIVAPMPLSMTDGGPLEVRVGAPPEGGKANKELVEYLEELFSRAAAVAATAPTSGSSPSQARQQQQRVSVDVRVAQGMTSRSKVIEVVVTPTFAMSDSQLWAALVDASHNL